MLINLHVKNLAIIDEVEVDFIQGLNILSGETGAGKSIIIGSINMALGSKIPKDIIREGKDYALVELLFSIDNDYLYNELLKYDIPIEDRQILISRKITNTRSVCRVNGETVTTSILQQMAELLLNIHGQHDNQTLLSKKKHLDILDKYAKDEVKDLKKKVFLTYNDYMQNKKLLDESVIDNDKRIREISFLEYEINEIESAKLIEGEDIELTERCKILSNMNNIIEGLSETYGLTSGENSDSAANDISRGIKALSRISEYDNKVSGFLDELLDIENLMSDFNKDVAEYMDNAEDCSEELAQVEERLNLINSLKSKYGNTISDVMIYCDNSKIKLEKLNNYEEYIEGLTENNEKLERQLVMESEALSKVRKEESFNLAQKVREALIDLNFLNVQFEMSFSNTIRYSANGIDDVEFMISMNPGEKLRPLVNIASGGELSRIMLALKSVMADSDSIETLIFDEIDAGISGRTAQKVSEKLSMISRNRQIICITHLPQIAAMADTHFIIEKQNDNNTTYTSIRKLDNEESVLEIARIIGGAKITETVINNAHEMIELANSLKIA